MSSDRSESIVATTALASALDSADRESASRRGIRARQLLTSRKVIHGQDIWRLDGYLAAGAGQAALMSLCSASVAITSLLAEGCDESRQPERAREWNDSTTGHIGVSHRFCWVARKGVWVGLAVSTARS